MKWFVTLPTRRQRYNTTVLYTPSPTLTRSSKIKGKVIDSEKTLSVEWQSNLITLKLFTELLLWSAKLWEFISGVSITFLTSLFVNYRCLLELPWMKNSLGNKDFWTFLSLPSWPRNTARPSDTYVISDTFRLSNITSDSFHSPRHNMKKGEF